jgi:hypothetical protein
MISRKSAHEGGKVVSPKHQPPLPPGEIPGTRFCQRLNRPQGHSAARRSKSVKNSITPSGIEPATFRIVAQCLRQPRHRVRPIHVTGACNYFTVPLTLKSIVVTICLAIFNIINRAVESGSESVKTYRPRLRPQFKILTRYSNSRALIATVTIRLILKYRL